MQFIVQHDCFEIKQEMFDRDYAVATIVYINKIPNGTFLVLQHTVILLFKPFDHVLSLRILQQIVF